MAIKIIGEVNSSQDGQVHDISGDAKCLSAGHNNSPKVAIPVCTPEVANKNQNGRRFKDNNEPMFTLTARDRHGVGVDIRYTEDGFHQYKNDEKKSSIQGTHVTYPEGKVHCMGTSHTPMVADGIETIGIINDEGGKNNPQETKTECPTLKAESHGNTPKVVGGVYKLQHKILPGYSDRESEDLESG